MSLPTIRNWLSGLATTRIGTLSVKAGSMRRCSRAWLTVVIPVPSLTGRPHRSAIASEAMVPTYCAGPSPAPSVNSTARAWSFGHIIAVAMKVTMTSAAPPAIIRGFLPLLMSNGESGRRLGSSGPSWAVSVVMVTFLPRVAKINTLATGGYGLTWPLKQEYHILY